MASLSKAAALVKARADEALQRQDAMDRHIENAAPPSPQMNLFPDDSRVIPNHLARSPLFSSVRPGRRKVLKNTVLASPKGCEIVFNGEQLDQSDSDVLMQLIHESRGRTVGEGIVLNRAEFLRALGRDVGGQNYAWLSSVFERLSKAHIKVTTPRYLANLHLINKTIEDQQTGVFLAVLDSEIIKMFSGSEFTYVDWEKRKKLARRVDVCKWLQSFICSNEKGLQRHAVANLKEWSGYSSPLRKFKESLQEAIAELERVEIIANPKFYADGEKVSWTRL